MTNISLQEYRASFGNFSYSALEAGPSSQWISFRACTLEGREVVLVPTLIPRSFMIVRLFKAMVAYFLGWEREAHKVARETVQAFREATLHLQPLWATDPFRKEALVARFLLGRLKSPEEGETLLLTEGDLPYKKGLDDWVLAGEKTEERGKVRGILLKAIQEYRVTKKKPPSLILNGYHLKVLPEGFLRHEALAELTILSLTFNELTALPDEVWEQTSLQKLGISNNKFTQVPSKISRLINLKHLGLNDNLLADLPNELFSLSQLETLNLSGNRLTRLPEQIGLLTRLKVLSVAENRLVGLSDALLPLTQLRELWLNRNRLTTLPDQILSLSAECHVSIEFNLYPLRIYETLQRICGDPTYRGPVIKFNITNGARDATEARTLPHLLQELCRVGRGESTESDLLAFSLYDQLTDLWPEAQAIERLREWLSRLASAADYERTADLHSRRSFADHIISYLELLASKRSPSFNEGFLLILEGACSSCGDRVALSVLHIGMHHRVATALTEDLLAFATLLLRGPCTLKILQDIADTKVASLRLVDQIEVYLVYPVKLKERLQIPIDISNMSFEYLSGVEQAELEEAARYVESQRADPATCLNFLVGDGAWLKALRANSKTQAQMEALEQEKERLLKAATSEREQAMIYAQHEAQLKELTRRLLYPETGTPST